MGGEFKHLPQGPEAVAARIFAIEKRLRDLERANRSLGLTVDSDGNLIFDAAGKDLIIKGGSNLDIQDDGSATIDGTLGVGGTATVGGTLNVTGNENVSGTLHVTGDTVIGGTLSLPNGIINNAALANPVTSSITWADVNSTNLTVAGSYFVSAPLTVPTGFTSALITCTATVGNTRSAGAGAAPFYMAAWIGDPTVSSATSSATISSTCEDGSSLSATATWVRELTGLTAGVSIQAGAWGAVDTTTGWTAGAANGHVAVSAIFLR